LGRTRVGLRGRHQAANVAVADALLDALQTAGIATIPDDARRRGYADARWPGRLELLRAEGRDILLDGAHNPAGAAALATALDELRPFLGSGNVTLVTASMADKDVGGVVRALAAATSLRGARVVATRIDLSRSLPAAELAAIWRSVGGDVAREITIEPDPQAALDRALAGPPGPIVVAGSLYLVGAIRARLVNDPLLRDPVDNRP
ncbi:MAG TPA: cyanophycin synthetase, partial [Candidatus Bathyarchaeia archaeon]|nr:cyanophycin synthetase [Candidatus Bathyarchaeia archaeon]